MLTQRLLAHVPLLLHPNPQRAAIIGLGSGVTLGSALTHRLDRRRWCSRSHREVVEASHFFDAREPSALADPRTRLVVGDGRTHLLLASEPTTSSCPSRPTRGWPASRRCSRAILRGREGAAGARRRAVPVGAHLRHQRGRSAVDRRDLPRRCFPMGRCGCRRCRRAAGGLDRAARWRLGGIAAAWQRPGVAADLASVGARSPLAVLSAFVAEGAALKAWADGEPGPDRRPGAPRILGAAQRLRRRRVRQRPAAAGTGRFDHPGRR